MKLIMSVSQTNSMQKTAIVIGATGLVGKHLVEKLISSGQYATIYQVVRKEPKLDSATFNEIANQPLNQNRVKNIVVSDFAKLDEALNHLDLKGADAFSTLGTTLKQAGSKEAFREIDFNSNLNFAALVKQRGATHYLLISATGADADSMIFYNQVKGELEQAVEQLNFDRLSFFQPSLLIGEHQDQRLLEGIGQQIFNLAKRVVPETWAYRPIEAERVAKAMCIVANMPKQQHLVAKTIYSNANLLTLTLENPA